MTIQQLPTRTDLARYDFDIELDGVTFNLAFEWNDRDEGWYVTIRDASDVVLLAGKRVVLNFPLISRYRDTRLPAGTIDAYDTSGTDTEAGLSDLGDRVRLVYTPVAEL